MISDNERKFLGAIVKRGEGLKMERRKNINKPAYGDVTGV
jgi:hypothetical protein